MKIIGEGGQGQLIEKKSRFIATVRAVRTEDEAQAFISEMKKKYWDARHNCSAFVIGDRRQLTRCSDDGEPAGTAGRPMLELLLKEDLTDVCVVVTRYFGGVLLGTGGLVRAYQGAVQEGLAASRISERKSGYELTVTTDYSLYGKVQYLLETAKIPVKDTIFEADVTIRALVPEQERENLRKKLEEGTDGNVLLEWSDLTFYVV